MEELNIFDFKMWMLLKRLFIVGLMFAVKFQEWYYFLAAEASHKSPEVLDGTAGQYFTEEALALQQLRLQIPDVMEEDPKFGDDLYLLLWLTTKDFEPNETESAIRESIQWRKDVGLYLPNPTYPEEFRVDFPKEVSNKSKDGCPVTFTNAGKYDLAVGLEKYGREKFLYYWGVSWLRLENIVLAYNHRLNPGGLTGNISADSVRGAVTISNVLGFNSWQFIDWDVLAITKEMVGDLMKYFPAVVRTIIIVNTNSAFSMVFKLIKPLISEPYINIELYSTDTSEWQPRIRQFIDDHNLPPYLQ